MGNLFLGFPVARAKIADMISASAPPSLHKSQHQLGGTDALDVTGLPGTGGGGGGAGSLHTFSSCFESLTGFGIQASASGSTTLTQYALSLSTGATPYSTARITKTSAGAPSFINFDKNCSVSFDAYFVCNTSVAGTFCLKQTRYLYDKQIGFKVINGILYGSVGDGNNETAIILQTISAVPFEAKRTLRAVFTAGVKCEFYVDATLLGTITTGLPAGAGNSGYYLYCWVGNSDVAEIKQMFMFSFNAQFTQ